jgi:hypothetical protein
MRENIIREHHNSGLTGNFGKDKTLTLIKDKITKFHPILWRRGPLFLSESHFFKLTMGLGNGTNNYVEIMSFKILLLFSKEKGVISFQIFWDSMLAIN